MIGICCDKGLYKFVTFYPGFDPSLFLNYVKKLYDWYRAASLTLKEDNKRWLICLETQQMLYRKILTKKNENTL